MLFLLTDSPQRLNLEKVHRILKSDSHRLKEIHFICFIESPLKIMRNSFYFILKTLFVLKIFKFLS